MMRSRDMTTLKRRTEPSLSALLIVVAMLVLPACSSGYDMSGRVIEGDFSHVQFVDVNDPRLTTEGKGLDGAQVVVYRDPSTLGRKLAAQGGSGRDGTFSFRVSEFGAGWLDEEWEIAVVRPRYANAMRLGQLPRNTKNMRVLVTLAPGDSTSVPLRNPYQDDLERFGGN